MSRKKKKAQPSTPADIVARRMAERETFINHPEPRAEDGPSARLFRQMVRLARAAPPPAPEADFEWSEAQLKRMARAEQKLTSKIRRDVVNGRAEMSTLMAERSAHLMRVTREREAAETLAIAEAQGQPLDAAPVKPGEGVKPMRRRSGLEWLRRKDRLSDDQFMAGQRYADDFRISEETPLKSCLSDVRGANDLNGMETREEAYQRLKAARTGALSSHSGMIVICDEICGQGLTIRQLTGDNDAEAQQLEARLCIALDLLSDHYGIKNIENRIRVSHWA
ncbi:MAG: hypothetical protein EON59_07640 [Alphaproteobacteria bacterium]|nr:MAG: hypothetical protein EON59_07640 [Alphaproteobacteria bacterium]